ncbi:MAG TPA: uracil-DNA glycosylase [Terriglobales bacterium]|nr:uracil-DNA glycosylase [Terriglobales bacterium]
MARPLDAEQRRALAARLEFYRDLGIFDFYRREARVGPDLRSGQGEARAGTDLQSAPSREAAVAAVPVAAAPIPDESSSLFQPTFPEQRAGLDTAAKLKIIREDLGDCTRCPLHKQGRKQIVFGVGDPQAELMFVGEGPGADEDAQGEPFVGRAGQLLNDMIRAMGLKREQVYIANVVKCRPPGNRTPEREECETCLPFLLRQAAAIGPKCIVALGAVAAKNLLGLNDSMANLRGRWYDFRGARLAVTYHPAYLLRDPRQKGEAWKDLQMVMKFLGLTPPKK